MQNIDDEMQKTGIELNFNSAIPQITGNNTTNKQFTVKKYPERFNKINWYLISDGYCGVTLEHKKNK